MRKYENLECLHENTLKPRSYYIPYDTEKKAKNGDKTKSDYYTLLNGEWDFRYYARDIDCPEKITEWDKVTVPSCWQMTGYEKPYYTNASYPYPLDPPYVPDDNPVGVYRKLIKIEKPKSELEKDKYTNVRIDYKVSGIGSDSCGPHLAERYQMNDKEIRFNYLIKKND